MILHHLTRFKKIYLLCVAIFGVILGGYMGVGRHSKLTDGIRSFACQSFGENIFFQEDVAIQLQHITRELMGTSGKVNRRIVMQLNQLISQLDPRYALSINNIITSDPPPIPDTCGEEFKGSRYGPPFFETGFVVSSSCQEDQKPTLDKLLTVLLFNMKQDLETLKSVLNGVKKYNSDLPVYVAASAGEQLDKVVKTFRNAHLLNITKGDLDQPGKVWNTLIKAVKTPYAVVAPNLFYFNWFSRLKRQIFVISNASAIGVAGGAFRNETGHWKVGCHVSQIRNYFLKYTEGYQHSAMDCMFCDYIEGPFIARTSILKQIPFDEKLPHGVLFKDWFLLVKQSHTLVVSCPDVMYFKAGPVEEFEGSSNKDVWLQMAKKWQVNQIFFPPATSVSFSCQQLDIQCGGSVYAGRKSMLMPTCCFQQIHGAVKALDDFAKAKGIAYEIEAGSLLGAVKLRHYMPWDVDGDITFLIKDLKVFIDNQDTFQKQGYTLNSFEKGKYFKLNTPDIYFEMWGEKNISTHLLPADMWKVPTLLKFTGVWMRGVWNPGLFARNRYGPNYLKHAQHWSVLDMKDSWVTYRAGSWVPCPNAHHACLDRYPVEGSIGFLPENAFS